MQVIIKENKWFFYSFFCYLFIGFILLLFIKKGDEIYFINNMHTPIGDFIMKYLTDLGDGIFVSLVILLLLWKRYDYFLAALLSFAITAIIVQFLKRIIFPDMFRPLKYLGDNAGLHLVEGVTVHRDFSFPSGHSATAFMIFCILSLVIDNKKLGLLFFFGAFIVSLTRPYLVQHFFMDIYVGATIGVAITLIIWNFVLKHDKIKNNNKWLGSLRRKRTNN